MSKWSIAPRHGWKRVLLKLSGEALAGGGGRALILMLSTLLQFR